MIEAVLRYVTPTSVLDIGANIGDFYREAKKVLPDADFFLIEPNPECVEALITLPVNCYFGAVSDTVKTVPFMMSKLQYRCTGNSLYRENTHFFYDENMVQHEVTTTTLDLLFGENHAGFDLIKIDTQGSELDILKGGERLVQKAKAIILEVAVAEYNIGAPRAEEVFKYMDEIGFQRMEKVGSNNNPDTQELVHEDYLFIKKDLFDDSK